MKNFNPIIKSLLETDLYKFTMWQVMLHRFPRTRQPTVLFAGTRLNFRWPS